MRSLLTRILLRPLLAALLLSVHLSATAEAPRSTAGTMEVYVREGCPHCAAAKDHLVGFSAEHPQVRIVLRSLDTDATAREDLIRHSRSAGVWPPGVPTFVFDGKVLVGFESEQRTGPELAALVDRSQETAQGVETGIFGTLSVPRLGLPLFTLALGLIDGFNPCAMWVLLFLLSLLLRLHDRKRMALVAGTFVVVSGAVYYAFMAAWLNVFRLIGMATAVHWALGILAVVIGLANIRDFLSPGRGFLLSIPAFAKPWIYARMRVLLGTNTLFSALTGVAVLAIMVNVVELLCTAGFPAIYTAVLTQQELSPAAHYGYLGLYILGYMADDTLMVTIAVSALSSRKLSEETGRWLKFLSGIVMLALGAALIIFPKLLA